MYKFIFYIRRFYSTIDVCEHIGEHVVAHMLSEYVVAQVGEHDGEELNHCRLHKHVTGVGESTAQ